MKILFCKRVICQSEDNIEEMPYKVNTSEYPLEKHKENNEDEAWAALLNAPGFIKYINKHGWHFTESLAEYASSLMENNDETKHSWNCKILAKVYLSKNFSVPSKVTWGDLTYTANMAYADFYPDICQDEAACVLYASLVANDKDGYPGMIFHRWVSDVIGKKLIIDWEKFM